MNSFRVRIVTPNYVSEIEEITSLHLTTAVGEITVLPNHYPLMSAVDIGKVTMMKNDLSIDAFAGEGLLSVKESESVLLLSAFEFKDDIDVARAKASYERAYERIHSGNEHIDIPRAQAALKRALTRINIAESGK